MRGICILKACRIISRLRACVMKSKVGPSVEGEALKTAPSRDGEEVALNKLAPSWTGIFLQVQKVTCQVSMGVGPLDDGTSLAQPMAIASSHAAALLPPG